MVINRRCISLPFMLHCIRGVAVLSGFSGNALLGHTLSYSHLTLSLPDSDRVQITKTAEYEVHSSSPARIPKSQLAAEQPSENVGTHQKMTPAHPRTKEKLQQESMSKAKVSQGVSKLFSPLF